MTLQVQKIVMPEVRRSAVSPLTWEETLVGQVFAFDANQIRDEAKRQQVTNHDLLLWPTIQGLWDTYANQRVLAGYVPGTKEIPVCGLFLLSKKVIDWSQFHAVVTEIPGFMESGEDFVTGSVKGLLAWWDPPCTMVALWPRPSESDPNPSANGKSRVFHPNYVYGGFQASGKTYRFINRYYDVSG